MTGHVPKMNDSATSQSHNLRSIPTLSEAQGDWQHRKRRSLMHQKRPRSVKSLAIAVVFAFPLRLLLTYIFICINIFFNRQLAQKEAMMKTEVREIMRRGLVAQQTAHDDVHQARNEVCAALRSQEAGFRQQAQSYRQQALARSEAAVAASTCMVSISGP